MVRFCASYFFFYSPVQYRSMRFHRSTILYNCWLVMVVMMVRYPFHILLSYIPDVTCCPHRHSGALLFSSPPLNSTNSPICSYTSPTCSCTINTCNRISQPIATDVPHISTFTPFLLASRMLSQTRGMTAARTAFRTGRYRAWRSWLRFFISACVCKSTEKWDQTLHSHKVRMERHCSAWRVLLWLHLWNATVCQGERD